MDHKREDLERLDDIDRLVAVSAPEPALAIAPELECSEVGRHRYWIDEDLDHVLPSGVVATGDALFEAPQVRTPTWAGKRTRASPPHPPACEPQTYQDSAEGQNADIVARGCSAAGHGASGS